MKIRRLRKYRFPRSGKLVTFEKRQYYVTDEGQVYDGDKHRYVAQRPVNNGYMGIGLTSDDGVRQTSIRIHDLVASVFKRLLEPGEVVHHVNHIRVDNRVDNLQIINGSEHIKKHWQDGTMDGHGDKIRKARQDGRYNAVGDKMRKAWQDGCFENMPSKVSAKVKKAWQDGRMKGHGEKLRKAWQDGRYDAGREKLKNVGNSYRPARAVAQLTKDGQLVKVWPSSQETARNGFHHGSISDACNGHYHSKQGNNVYKGFKWMWLEDFNASQHDNPVTAPVQLELNFSED